MAVRRSPTPGKLPPIGGKAPTKSAPAPNAGPIGSKSTPRRTITPQAATTGAAAKGVAREKLVQKLKSNRASKLNGTVTKKQTLNGMARARATRER